MNVLHHALMMMTMLLGTAVFASTETTVDNTDLEAKKALADSLQAAADSLDKKAIELEKMLDGIEQSRADLRDEIEDQIEDLREVIEDIQERMEETLEDLQESQEAAVERIEEQIEEREERRHTGSFIVALEYARLDTDPLKQLQRQDNSLSGKYSFDFRNDNMMMFGLMGYYNLENNVRVGNGIYAGYKSFQSDVYTTTSTDSMLNVEDTVDSIVTLRVIPAYIGFVCEKAFLFDQFNLFAGAMIGGNLTVVVKEEERAQMSSSFISGDYDSDNESEFSVAFAPAVAWDVHGGMAFKLSPHMHVGIDGIVRFAYAYEGFGAGFGDFLSVSPGIRLRLTFGTAG